MIVRHLHRVLVSLVLLWSTTALAQDEVGTDPPDPDTIDVHILPAVPDSSPFLYTSSTWTPRHLKYGAGIQAFYGYKLFSIYDVDSSGSITGERASVVDWLSFAELYGYIGLWDRYMVAVSVPVGVVAGHKLNNKAIAVGDVPMFAWGDVRIYARGRVATVQLAAGRLIMGADGSVQLPTGQFSSNYTGQTLPTITVGGIAEYRWKRLVAAANVGAIIRLGASDSSFFDGTFEQGSRLHLGAGAYYKVIRRLDLGGELYWRNGFSTAVDENPMEVGVGAHYYVGLGLHARAGVNVGMISGMGVPLVRGMAGMSWYPDLKDTDHDGVPDEIDRCPFRAEDHDGFQDSDGCPELDNDRDGIEDKADKCPLKPEDLDDFQDDDGCPDPDNDGDGIPDKDDHCPGAKGPKEKHGCPANMVDTDEDGVPDSDDQCPKEPGDKKRKGCPADKYDSDGDGLVDAKDDCPDKKGTKEYGGCPPSMFDSDEDGVPDDLDKCPGKKETINGVKDFDGCPDKGRPWYKLSEATVAGETVPVIRFRKRIRWFTEPYGTELTGEAKAALGQVVLFVRTHQSSVKKLLVLIHTDLLIPKGRAMEVTQAQAKVVQKWLIEHRLPEDKVIVQPMGNEMPLVRKGGSRRQRRNRRIDFIIKM